MLVLPVGPYTPVAPVAPVARIVARKTKGPDKTGERGAQSKPARSAAAMASHPALTALEDMKLGG